ncbi:MAG: hypothetical protein SF053_12805 [Bacteroidia bacterium]|nr:hypothetical protein [Bacteroidia bacterium]
MKTRLRNILITIHIAAWAIVIVNTLVQHLYLISLAGNIEVGIEVVALISGLALFFLYLKPFEKINVYFSMYAVSAFLLVGAYLFRSLLLGYMVSVLLFPFIPDEKKFEENGVIISVPFQGVMSRCCSYKVTERYLLIFEKNDGIWELEEQGPIDFGKVQMISREDEIEIIYSTGVGEAMMRKKKIKKYASHPSASHIHQPFPHPSPAGTGTVQENLGQKKTLRITGTIYPSPDPVA